MTTIKALTLTQPWASLVGIKLIETRSWSTAYRGPLAIHAAKGFAKPYKSLCNLPPFAQALESLGLTAGTLPLGQIVSVCQLVTIIPTAQFLRSKVVEFNDPKLIYGGRQYRYELTDQERAFGDYTAGRFAWLLADFKRLEQPIPATGKLSLWDWATP